MWCQLFDLKYTAPSRGHFRWRLSTRDLLASAVSARPDQAGENIDVHPWRPVPPSAELLKSLQETDCNSTQLNAK